MFKAYLDAVAQGRHRELEGYGSILGTGQELKDKSVINAPRDYTFKATKPEIRTLTSNAVKAYAEAQLHLDESNRQIAHSLKNECVEIDRVFSSRLPDQEELKSMLAELDSLHLALREGAKGRMASFFDSLQE